MDKGSERMVAMTEGAIGWMIFNHPARHNAVSMAMWQGVVRIIEAFKADPTVRAIIVTGAGERAFVSGADISEFGEKRATPAAIAEYDAVGVRALADTIVGNAPLSIAATKRCVGEALKDADRRDMAACQAAVDACYASADYVEGRTAFMEKRRPVFRAR